MKRVKVILSRLKNWLYDAWPFWLFSAGFIVAICFPSWFQLSLTDHIYYTGFLLQFFAFTVIIFRINFLRKDLGGDDKNFFGLALDWFKRFPSIFKKPKDYKFVIKPDHIKQSGSMASVVISAEKTLAQRVKDLEEKQKKLEKKLQETEGSLNKRINENVSVIKKQKKESEDAIEALKWKTRQFNAESLGWEIV